MKKTFQLPLLLGAFFLGTHFLSAQDAVEVALKNADAPKGVCAILGGDATTALKMTEKSEYVVLAQLPSADEVEKLRKTADEKNWLNKRLYVEKGGADKSLSAENTVDMLVSVDGKVSADEIKRVLAPMGCAVLGGAVPAGLDGAKSEGSFTVWKKPFPAEMDNWSYWYHETDNNTVSKDSVLKWPFHLQWLGKPYFGAQPRTTIVHKGIVYGITGIGGAAAHGAVADMINNASMVEARRAFNGEILWQRKIPAEYYTSRSAFCATDDAFYMIDDGKGLLALDPYTGKELGLITLDGMALNYKWIGIRDGILYVLAGEPDLPPPASGYLLIYKYCAPLVTTFKGEQFEKIWGFGKEIGAYDLKSKKTLWTHKNEGLLSSRFMAVADGKVYAAGDEWGALALDAKNGKPVWENKTPELLQSISAYDRGAMSHFPALSNTSPGLLATKESLVFKTVELKKACALSATDGKTLWSIDAGKNWHHPFAMNGQVCVLDTKGVSQVDMMTGASGASLLKDNGDGCGPVTASANGYYRRHSIFWDAVRNKPVNDHTFRSGCWQDAIPAQGLLFNTPYSCSCNYSLQSYVIQCPAGDFKFGQSATESERLEAGKATPSASKADTKDWLTHRANNKRTGSASEVSVPESASELWSSQLGQGVGATASIAVGGSVFYADDRGRVFALDAKSGKEKWHYSTGGKIFFTPTFAGGAIYVGSSDGFAYCLNSDTGALVWRFRASPQEQRIMVYDNLSSRWPVNTGVLVQDGVAYFGAGITSQSGTHVYALDAKTGKIVWQNNESGHIDKENLAGAAALGSFTISKNHLWLNGGNAASPVSYHLKTGVHVAPGHVAVTVSAKWQHSRGNEISNFQDALIITGGYMLYSDQPRRNVKAGLDNSMNFFNDQDGKVSYPELIMTSGRQAMPIWDDKQIFVTLSGRGLIECWDASKTLEHIRSITNDYKPGKMLKGQKPSLEPLETVKKITSSDYPMKLWGSLPVTSEAMAMGSNAIVVVNQKTSADGRVIDAGARNKGKAKDKKEKGGMPTVKELPQGEWSITAFSRADGKQLWDSKLPSEPIDGGLCLDRNGNAIVSFLDGTVKCFGKP